MNKNRLAARNLLIENIKKELIGPSEGHDEKLTERPDKRYLMGMLFPKNSSMDTLAEDVSDESINELDEDPIESPTDLLFQRLPASMGLSFASNQQKNIVLEITPTAFIYEKHENKWVRKKLTSKANAPLLITVNKANSPKRKFIFDKKAYIHVTTRSYQDATIVTVSLINNAELTEDERLSPSQVLYQTELQVKPVDGIIAYPSHKRLSPDVEDQELAMQYLDNPIFGIGHGCAVRWDKIDNNHCSSIRSTYLPTVEVPPVTTEIENLSTNAQAALSLQLLQSNQTSKEELITNLTEFVTGYEEWFKNQQNIHVPSSFAGAKGRVLSRIQRTLERMNNGVALLKDNDVALEAFQLANHGMLLQMAQHNHTGGEQVSLEKAQAFSPNLSGKEYAKFKWRPFQLAFFLTSLPGLWFPESAERDVVDLIWFPTGGGKTEAYLAISAFEIFRRRLFHTDFGGGTSIIMRYTLRLLTTDQFTRLSNFICALEKIRRRNKEKLGNEPITLGLWAGQSVSQNHFEKAEEVFSALLDETGEVKNPYPVQYCPVCGTELIPKFKELDDDRLGIAATTTSFKFFCPLKQCEFHEGLPINIIDEALYKTPPTLLIGTIDKFAMLAWNEKGKAFFGNSGKYAQPSLIIQDELHLITGPLGTIAGAYEAAIDTIISESGERPKIVCSTATIRKADDQIQQLYGRTSSIFPPPGISAVDSYFSKKDKSKIGRTYIGAMGQGHTPVFSTVLTAAALLETVHELNIPQEKKDSWWTLVMYHNSKRELGKSLTLSRDDIPARIEAVYGNKSDSHRQLSDPVELSGNISGEDIPNILKMLKMSSVNSDQSPCDVLACTNMLSVGVDIARLGLMLIQGQPKTTSEYIQASSRVGRSEKQLPGVVLTLYSPSKPRDRSHYESFTGYHESLYRYVEPTSVTPYALPARKRTLHALLILLIRYTVSGLSGNSQAPQITKYTSDVATKLEILSERIAKADPQEAEAADQELHKVLKDWIDLAEDNHKTLRFGSFQHTRNYNYLMKTFGHPELKSGFETLTSMRHVDASVSIRVMGEDDE